MGAVAAHSHLRAAVRNEREEYKVKHGFDGDARIFIVVGSKCRIVRDILSSWGWIENPNPNSHCFDLKWTTQPSKVVSLIGALPKLQLVNHFRGSAHVDSKTALARHLSACSACSSRMFPRQYDLTSSAALGALIDDCALTAAESILEAQNSVRETNGNASAVAARVVGRAKAVVAAGMEAPLVRCCHEWKALLGYSRLLPRCLEDPNRLLVERYRFLEHQPCDCESSRAQTHATDAEVQQRFLQTSESVEKGHLAHRSTHTGFIWQHRQKALNGAAHGLAWVGKKPHAKQGNGISVACDLRHLLEFCGNQRAKGQDWNCAVQKYCERCLTLGPERHKVDLRVWVLVSSWNPCVVFAHAAPYFRIAGAPFDFQNKGESQSTAHLTNRPQHEEENRLLLETFLSRLDAERPDGSVTFWAETWPRMADAIRLVVVSTQAAIVAETEDFRRKRKSSPPQEGPSCFELLGFDFCLDSDLHPWLLEVNVTPSMVDDCELLGEWVEEATSGLLNIVTGVHSGRLRMPSTADLSMPQQPATVGRLFSEQDDHSSFCLRRRVLDIPAGLVSGFEVADCSPWRLVFAERHRYPESELASRYSQLMPAGGGRAHDRVLRERLLPGVPKETHESTRLSTTTSSTNSVSLPLASPQRSSRTVPRLKQTGSASLPQFHANSGSAAKTFGRGGRFGSFR